MFKTFVSLLSGHPRFISYENDIYIYTGYNTKAGVSIMGFLLRSVVC